MAVWTSYSPASDAYYVGHTANSHHVVVTWVTWNRFISLDGCAPLKRFLIHRTIVWNVQFWSCYFSSQQLFYSLFCPGGERGGGGKKEDDVDFFPLSLSLSLSLSQLQWIWRDWTTSDPQLSWRTLCKQHGLHTLATIDLSCSVRAIWAVTRWNKNKSFKFSLPASSSNMMLMKMFSCPSPPLASAQHHYLPLFLLFWRER